MELLWNYYGILTVLFSAESLSICNSLRKLGTSEVLSVTLLRIVFVEMLKCISLAEIGTISDIVH